jgi:ABC-type lipopolysaccharide export system ATPase subunit
MRKQPPLLTEAGDAGGKVRESLAAVSIAQSVLPNLQATLAAGRAPTREDLAKLAKAASAFAEAADVLGLEPERATLADLKAELADRESSVRLRPLLRRLAHAAGPGTAAPGLGTLADEAARLAGKASWSPDDEARASTLAHLVELADLAVDRPDDDEHILSLDADLRRTLGPGAAPVVLAAARGQLVLPPIPDPVDLPLPASTEVIRTRDLTKIYPGMDLPAVDRLNLTVHAGEIFGLLGPNGAGKTTTAGMLTTRVLPTSGEAIVGGIDVVAHPALAKQAIGVVTQQNTLDRSLNVWENLYYHGRYFGMSRKASRAAAGSLLAQFHLARWAKAPVFALSGGMAQRLMVARAILHRPRILFMDEPTAGLDPRVDSPSGRSCPNSMPRARRSCSPRTTWRRRTSSVTGSRSWTTARCSHSIPRPASSPRWAPKPSSPSAPKETSPPSPRFSVETSRA